MMVDFKNGRFQIPQQNTHMRCFYSNGGSDWLRLGPMKVELISEEPYVAVIRQVLFEDECDKITDFLTPQLGFPPGRSTRAKGQGLAPVGRNDWTMKK